MATIKIEPIKPEYKKILDKIRELYVQSGGKLLYKPENFGLGNDKSQSGIEIGFDYGTPYRMYTPDGSYVILGSSISGDKNKFWELFNQEFEVEIVKPIRDDSKISGLEFQLECSGPTVRIMEK